MGLAAQRVEKAKALLVETIAYPESAKLDYSGNVVMTVAEFQVLCELLHAYCSMDLS